MYEFAVALEILDWLDVYRSLSGH